VLDFVGQHCSGSVKRFSETGGYGFLAGDEFSEDVFVNFKLAPTLKEVAQSGVSLNGSRVRFVPRENQSKPGSYEATEVEFEEDMAMPEADASSYVGQWVRGYFKSFNLQKGWGFLSSTSFPDDVFVNYKLAPNIRDAAQVAGLQGQPATFLLKQGKTQGSYEAGAVQLLGGAAGKGGPIRPIVPTSSYGKSGYGKSSYGTMMGGYGKMGGMQQGYAMYGGKGMQKGGKGGSATAYEGSRVHGYFKSFNLEKGWGFLKSFYFDDDLFVSYKLAPNIQHRGPLQDVAASFVVSRGQKPGSFEATDVQLEGDAYNSGWSPKGDSGWSSKGGGYGPAKGKYGSAYGDWGGAGASPYGPRGGKGRGGVKTEAAEEGMAFVGTTVEGSIKSFSSQNSWGFVTADAFSDDCFFSLRTNPHLEATSVVKGRRVQFTVQASQKRSGTLEASDILIM